MRQTSSFESVIIKLASPEEILSWSHGEVLKPETINYRTQRAEKDGLFCERIFGPEKDYQCYCGKYRGIRFKGVVCDRCGVEVTSSTVRRERMGHIKLAAPVSHIWFLRGIPSAMGLILNIPAPQLEKVIYFASYIIEEVDEKMKKEALEKLEKEYKQKIKGKKKKEIEKLKVLFEKAREEILSLKPFKILSEIEYRALSMKYGEIFKAGTGAETLRRIFEKIDLDKEIQKIRDDLEKKKNINKKKAFLRLRLFSRMKKAGIRPEWMFLTVLPVLPPDLRPMVQLDGGRFASSDLNDLYRRIINRNNRLKYLLEIGAPEVIVRNEKRMLQEAVDALIDNSMRKSQTTKASSGERRLLKSLADMLRGKQGHFRQNLLGKRVDYSGRSVIVVGPELKLYQVGLPKKMALELFKPFVIKGILDRELAYNTRAASRLIEKGEDIIWAILEEVVKDKLVLLNRAPTLHRLGIQAFYPVLIEGKAIRIHPLVCKAYNADFDGDQMAVFLPLSEEAQKEARERMISTKNLLKPATGLPIVNPTQDIILGCYWLTTIKEGAKGEGKIFSDKEEALLALEAGDIDIRAKIKVRIEGKLIQTSAGRIIFNNVLPSQVPFQNKQINSKELSKIITFIIERAQIKDPQPYLDKIKELGFEYATLSGISWGMDDLIVPKEKKKIIEKAEKEVKEIERNFKRGFLSPEEKRSQIIEVWQRVKMKIEELVKKTLPPLGPVYCMVDSGARGSWIQPIQMTGMKGLVTNPLGEIIELPVKSSYKEGFNVLEYFISTHGARKGTVDTALRTAKAGYLTRRLIDVAHEVIVTEEDCKDRKGIIVSRKEAEEIGQDFIFKIIGRTVAEDVKDRKGKLIVQKGEIIDWEKADKIIEEKIEEIRVRSPLTCKTKRGVCQKCYGWDLGNNRLIKLGEAVGIVAAQAIGEPGTQLTLRTFHTGGVAGGGDITQGLPRVEEVFEARSVSGEAVLSLSDGKVVEVDKKKKIIKVKAKNPNKIIEYKIPPESAIWVKKGQEIKKGDQLCEGNIDVKKLFKLVGAERTQKYILKEVQRIYASQGVDIHDKHIEIIIRQMFSRLKVKNPGESDFLPGEIVEKPLLLEENEKLKSKGKKPATFQQIILGISRVALTTDSFLSAASFQETSRVLIKAALEGKEDKLRGLKENVILGRLIPAGTGFRKTNENEKEKEK